MKQLYIAGDWRDGVALRENVNPSDVSDVIDRYAQADAALAGEAVAAAAAAFPGWSRTGPQVRHDALRRVADEIEARAGELGDLLAREEGKTIGEAKGEVLRAAQIFRFFSGECLRPQGEALPSVRPGVGVEITREPVGVVAIITPWNFPLAIPAWKIAPALAWGNTVVFKPADLVPGSAWALAEILSRAGLPPGVFNLVMGRGGVVGEVLLSDPRVTAITFTGSVATGRRVAAAAAARFAKCQLEMGGKNPLVVLDDADLSVAVECAINGAFYSTGQRCTASSRLIVTEGVHDRFVAAMLERMQALKVGDARDPETQIGPVVDEAQLAQDEGYIATGTAEGGRLAWGGHRVAAANRGHFLAPALFTETTPAMTLNREEVFGPVASVIRVKDYEEALAVANGTEFGLSAGICTTSLKHATHFRRNAEAGMVMVNLPTAGVDYHVPFGGRKGSSWGPREQGRYAAEFFTTVKTAYTLA